MDWLRLYHGTMTDSKWLVIAKLSECRRCEVSATWAALLECASQARPRGSVLSFDAGAWAAFAEIDPAMVERIINSLTSRGMINQQGRLTEWSKRQGLKTDETAAERQRKSRATKDSEPAKADNNRANGCDKPLSQVSRSVTPLERESEALDLLASASAASSSCSVSSFESKSNSDAHALSVIEIEQRLQAAGIHRGLLDRAFKSSELAKWAAMRVTGEHLAAAIDMGRAKRAAARSAQPLNIGFISTILGDIIAGSSPMAAASPRVSVNPSPDKPREDQLTSTLKFVRHQHSLGVIDASHRDQLIEQAMARHGRSHEEGRAA